MTHHFDTLDEVKDENLRRKTMEIMKFGDCERVNHDELYYTMGLNSVVFSRDGFAVTVV